MKLNQLSTRMLSSRMHTYCSSPYGGVSLTETPLDRDSPGQRSPDRDPTGQRPPLDRDLPLDRDPQDRDSPVRNMGPETETPSQKEHGTK